MHRNWCLKYEEKIPTEATINPRNLNPPRLDNLNPFLNGNELVNLNTALELGTTERNTEEVQAEETNEMEADDIMDHTVEIINATLNNEQS